MREWKPGDVAMYSYLGSDLVALRVGTCRNREHDSDGSRGHWRLSNGGWTTGTSGSIRPLVLIDPEDREQVERLAKAGHGAEFTAAWDEMHGGLRAERVDVLQAALREFADPKPPRIDEPGTWGVVEAACPHSNKRQTWVHHPDGNWWPAFDYSTVPERTPLPDDWSDLVDPTLVREGVTP